jgi:aryl-alcohol dehydrogenase-like predicted oxidoreductase
MTTARRLGRTDLEVPPIGLGTWQFSGGHGMAGRFWEAIAQSTIDEVVDAALRGGIRLFDTAEMYGNGESERRLSSALRTAGKKPGDVTIATKWNPIFRVASSIAATIDVRLQCLAPFPIDLYQVHQPLGLSTVEAEMNAMADLVAAHKVRFVGVSNFGPDRMRRAHVALAARGLVLASNQVKYSLLDRAIERDGTLALARELGVAIIAYSPLEQGLLTGRFHDDPDSIRARPGPRRFMPAFHHRRLAQTRPVIDALRQVARAHGAEPSQVALAWLTQFHGDLVFAIPGASRRAQAETNAGALELKLTPEELRAIDEVSWRLGSTAQRPSAPSGQSHASV